MLLLLRERSEGDLGREVDNSYATGQRTFGGGSGRGGRQKGIGPCYCAAAQRTFGGGSGKGGRQG